MPVEGRSPLHNAALESGDRLRQLISEGADVHARDAKGRTPLHNACQKQPVHVPLLLAAGADPNARDLNQMTPLHYAAASGFSCKELLVAHADRDAQDVNGHTPLFHAAATGHSTSAVDLICAGADPRIADLTGETLFDHLHPWLGSGCIDELWLVDARMHGPDRLAQHLRKLIDGDEYLRIQMVLNPALLNGRHWWTKDQGPLPLQAWTALADDLTRYCTERSAWHSLHALHASGLPVTPPDAMRGRDWPRRAFFNVPKDKAAMALILAAADSGHGVPLLLALEVGGCKPAIDAAFLVLCGQRFHDGQDVDIARIALLALWDAGAKLESRAEAVAQQTHAAMRQPVGADGGLLWEDGRKYSHAFLGFTGAMSGLTRPVAFTPLLSAADAGSPLLGDLIALGADLDAVDRFGRNALHLATSSGGEQAVVTLLEAGLAVDATDAQGYRALVRAPNAAMAALLLRYGASPVLTAIELQELGGQAAAQLQEWIRLTKREPDDR